jgi:hypothetical protein
MAVIYPDEMKCLNIGEARSKGGFCSLLPAFPEISADESAGIMAL